MSRKNTDFIKKNIRDADNMAKDELTRAIREHDRNKTVKKKKEKAIKMRIKTPNNKIKSINLKKKKVSKKKCQLKVAFLI